MSSHDGSDVAALASVDAALARGRELFQGAGQRLSQIVAAERCFRRALELSPDSAEAMAHIARTLQDQGRWTEAKALYDRALAIDPSSPLAMENHSEAVRELGLDLVPDRRRLVSRYPETIEELLELRGAMKRFCLGSRDASRLRITNATRIVTFGSCFAANLAAALNQQDIPTHNLGLGEVFNSTYSNLELIEWLFGIKETAGAPILQNFGDGREEIAAWVRDADVVIYTLGVASCYFEAATDSFILPGRLEGVRGALSGKYVFRTTSVEENHRNLVSLVGLIREYNPRCTFVFSLSPVPLAATLEHRSVMEADCLSKATLRLAVEQLTHDMASCLYWPAFEMVRGLGVYVPGMYGEQDGSPHHVSESVVRTVVGLFLETYGDLSG